MEGDSTEGEKRISALVDCDATRVCSVDESLLGDRVVVNGVASIGSMLRASYFAQDLYVRIAAREARLLAV